MSNNYEIDYRQLFSYINKQPVDWHQDPPMWLLTLDEYNSLNPGAMLSVVDGPNIIKGVDQVEVKLVALGENTYVNIGVRGHLFVEDEKFIPEGVSFPSAV